MGGVNDESREANLRASLFTVVKKKKNCFSSGWAWKQRDTRLKDFTVGHNEDVSSDHDGQGN